jgi:hypothetical protein
MQKPTEKISTINTFQNESTGLTPRMMRIKTRAESGNNTPIGGNPTPKKREREETVPDEDEDYIIPTDFDINDFDKVKNFIDSLNDSQLHVAFLRNGIITKGDLEEKHDIYTYFTDICKSKGFVKKHKKKQRNINYENIGIPQPNFDFDASEIIIPPGFNIKNFNSVSKFIDSLNAPQLQKVLDRQFLVEMGDIQEERIKEYFKAACSASGVKKTKKQKSKKVSKVVKEWILKDEKVDAADDADDEANEKQKIE